MGREMVALSSPGRLLYFRPCSSEITSSPGGADQRPSSQISFSRQLPTSAKAERLGAVGGLRRKRQWRRQTEMGCCLTRGSCIFVFPSLSASDRPSDLPVSVHGVPSPLAVSCSCSRCCPTASSASLLLPAALSLVITTTAALLLYQL